MLTKKQEQGLRILESIVQSQYPFVVSLSKSGKYELNDYATSMGIKLEIDPITLSKYVGLPLAKKFKETPIWDLYMRDDELLFVLHLFEDKDQDKMGWKFNKGMEEFITQAYSQLPTNMRVNMYSHSPDYDIPDWANGMLHTPRSISIDKFYLAPDSTRPNFED
jgi:PleD family two-component response regulator